MNRHHEREKQRGSFLEELTIKVGRDRGKCHQGKTHQPHVQRPAGVESENFLCVERLKNNASSIKSKGKKT